MSKIKNGGLGQYGAGPFEQQQFGTAGVERVNITTEYADDRTSRVSFITYDTFRTRIPVPRSIISRSRSL